MQPDSLPKYIPEQAEVIEKKEENPVKWEKRRKTIRAIAEAIVRTIEQMEAKLDPKGSEHRLRISDLKQLLEISPNPEKVEELIIKIVFGRLRTYLNYRVLGVAAEGGLTLFNTPAGADGYLPDFAQGPYADIGKASFLLTSLFLQIGHESIEGDLNKIIQHDLEEILLEIQQAYSLEKTKGIVPDVSKWIKDTKIHSLAEAEKVYPYITQIIPAISTQLGIFTLQGNYTLAGIYAGLAGLFIGLQSAVSKDIDHPFYRALRSTPLATIIPSLIALFEADALASYKDTFLPVIYLLQRIAPNIDSQSSVEKSSEVMRAIREMNKQLFEINTTLCTESQKTTYRKERLQQLLNAPVKQPLLTFQSVTVEKPTTPDLSQTEYITQKPEKTNPTDVYPWMQSLRRRSKAVMTGIPVEQLTPKPKYDYPAVKEIVETPTEQPQAVFIDFCVQLQSGNLEAAGGNQMLLNRTTVATEPGKLFEVLRAGEQVMRALALVRKSSDGMCVITSTESTKSSVVDDIDTVYCDLKTEEDRIEYSRTYFHDYPLSANENEEEFAQLVTFLEESGLLSQAEITDYLQHRAGNKGLSGGRSELRFKLQLLEAFSTKSDIVVIHKLFDKFSKLGPAEKAVILKFLVSQAQSKVIIYSRPEGTESLVLSNPDFCQHITRTHLKKKERMLASDPTVDDLFQLFDEFEVPYSLPVNYERTAPERSHDKVITAADWADLNSIQRGRPFNTPFELFSDITTEGTTELHRMTVADLRRYVEENEIDSRITLPDVADDAREVLFRRTQSIELDIVYTAPDGQKHYLYEQSQRRIDTQEVRDRNRRGLAMKFNPQLYPNLDEGQLPVELVSGLIAKEMAAHQQLPINEEAMSMTHQENILMFSNTYSLPLHITTTRYELEIDEETYTKLLAGFTALNTASKTVGHYVFKTL